jgi:putative transposase
MLKDFGMLCSMSGKLNCYDNAITETWFHSFKMEIIFGVYFVTRAEAKSAIFAYIEELYNRKRKHSSLGYCSPVKFEQQYELVA